MLGLMGMVVALRQLLLLVICSEGWLAQPFQAN
jgi:hypothetical protein